MKKIIFGFLFSLLIIFGFSGNVFAYSVGETAQGGKVFYIDNDTVYVVADEISESLMYNEASIGANNLTVGGFDDWRIPIVYEMVNLFNSGLYNPLLSAGGYVWTSSEIDGGGVIIVNMSNGETAPGGVADYYKTAYVRTFTQEIAPEPQQVGTAGIFLPIDTDTGEQVGANNLMASVGNATSKTVDNYSPIIAIVLGIILAFIAIRAVIALFYDTKPNKKGKISKNI